jgi:hypothetical protein
MVRAVLAARNAGGPVHRSLASMKGIAASTVSA